jgi:hypothetical protein
MKPELVKVEPILMQTLLDYEEKKRWNEIMAMDDEEEEELSGGLDWGLSFFWSMAMMAFGATLAGLLMLALNAPA